jgi:arsenite oxidase small subunit
MTNRRDFFQSCTQSGAALCAMSYGAIAQAVPLEVKKYARTKLVNQQGLAIKATQISVRKNYLFHYPFESTPAFLLRMAAPVVGKKPLNTPKGDSWLALPGIGPGNAFVAFSAICAHKLAYPTPQLSFISFQEKQTNKIGQTSQDVIHCCADHSQYDVLAGAAVLSGPAPQALTGIVIEHDARTDELFAVGTLGVEVYDAFFAKYDFKLQMDHGNSARRMAGQASTLHLMDNYCKQTARCSG